MRKITTLIVSALAVAGLGVAMLAPVSTPAGAAASEEVQKGTCKAGGGEWIPGTPATATTAATPGSCNGGNADTSNADLNKTIQTIINVMLYLVGILSVVMIIYSGIRYIISRGNTQEVETAKNTLMYSIIGLVVAILAFVIVQFVFKSLS